jgi:hypothetical protein
MDKRGFCKGWPDGSRPVLLTVLLALLLTGCTGVAERPSHFLTPDTGIPVGEPFADFYRQMGGAALFGHPLTEPFRAEEEGPLLQYFQTMRLEFDGQQVDQQVDQQVRITPLGEWAFAGVGEGVEIFAPPPDTRSRTFAQTGQAVWDEFLTFYESNQGEILLGLPLSSQLNEGGMRVQYFENGRLEWHPELPTRQRVQLTLLGQAHFQAEMAIIYQQISRNAGPISAADLTHVDIIASVRAPILYAGDQQILYLTVLRPDGRVVSDVRATATVIYDDVRLVYNLGQSDAEGKIQARLPLDDVPAGRQVLLDIRVYAPGDREIGRETLGFRTWW